MTRRPLFPLLAFGLAALLLGGCQTESARGPKDQQPIPAKTLALMKDKGMTRRDPILIRIYKEESELEVWKQNEKGRYAHLKTYEICRWSGTLGPKKTEGDGQAPEGFYQVTPGQMNPKSQYYLAFNLGYPNAYDRSLGRTGAHLMVHGDCLSKGCYAMTDEQIAEVYAIAREALNAGQPSFQVQAFPFRMTAENLARRRNDPNFEFWKNLKEGADHFEVTRLEPKVGVCGRKYVFDAEAKGGSLDPNAPCPDYEVNPLIASAVAAKQRQDEAKFAQLVASGLQVAEAYVPQNGRLRRSLKDPIHPPQPKAPAVMTAEAGAPAAQPAPALAMAGSAVPMPVPSPYVPAQAKPRAPGAFAWLRGGDQPAQPAATTPAAASAPTSSAAVAQTRRAPEPGKPVVASLAPTSKDQPFYKRWLGFGGKPSEAAPAAPAAASPAPAAPAPAPRPATAHAPAQQPAPAEQPAPQPAPATRADAAFQQFGGSQILNPGAFR